MNQHTGRAAATLNTFVIYAALALSASASGLVLNLFAALFLDGELRAVLLLAGLSLSLWRVSILLRRAAVVSGKPLPPSDYPWLHRLVTKACASTQTAPVTDIVLVPDYGVALVESLGVQWHRRRTLVVGIELIQSVDARSFAVAVQHALASAKGNIGSLGWLSLHINAMTLIDACLAQSGADAYLCKPLRKKINRHVARSAGLMRQHVLAVDRAVGRAGRSAVVACAIARIAVQERLLADTIWPRFMAGADLEPRPPYLPHVGIRVATELLTRTELHCAFARVLADTPDETRTTPCLRERLDGLGERGAFLDDKTRQPSAAVLLLGASYGAVIAEFDQQWIAENQVAWTERHESRKRLSTTLQEERPTQHQTQERLARARAKQQSEAAKAAAAGPHEKKLTVADNYAYAQRWVSTVVTNEPLIEFAH